ncbi:MAG: hypothetical protein ACK4TK_06545 [Thiobacillaceae bacterium]
MSEAESTQDDPYPLPRLKGDLAQLLAGLERQREDLGPIADELLYLLRQPPADPANSSDPS